MKKILNEWRKFTLNEAQSGVNDIMQQYFDYVVEADVEVPYRWFDGWGHKMEILESQTWWDYVATYGDENKIKSDITAKLATMTFDGKQKKPTPKEIQRLYNYIRIGYGYYVYLFLGKKAFEQLVREKIKAYMSAGNIKSEEKEFFQNYHQEIFDFGIDNMVPNNTKVWHDQMSQAYSGQVAFFGQINDFFMFGQGVELTKEIVNQFFGSVDKGAQ